MNKRLKELIKQSYDELNEPCHCLYARDLLMQDLLPEYQRFAELLIKKCTEVIGAVSYEECEAVSRDHYINEGLKAASNRISIYFGVKNER